MDRRRKCGAGPFSKTLPGGSFSGKQAQTQDLFGDRRYARQGRIQTSPRRIWPSPPTGRRPGRTRRYWTAEPADTACSASCLRRYGPSPRLSFPPSGTYLTPLLGELRPPDFTSMIHHRVKSNFSCFLCIFPILAPSRPFLTGTGHLFSPFRPHTSAQFYANFNIDRTNFKVGLSSQAHPAGRAGGPAFPCPGHRSGSMVSL